MPGHYLDHASLGRPSAGTVAAVLDGDTVTDESPGKLLTHRYGPEGMLATIRKLDAVGLADAGTGRNLAEARSPAFTIQ